MHVATAQHGKVSSVLQPLRVAVIGYGYWGSKHARVLSTLPGVEIAIVDSDPERRAAAQQAFSHVPVHAQLDDIVHSADGLVVATPPSSHAKITRSALHRGVSALVEKPMATSSTDAAQLVSLSDRSSAFLMVGHIFEYHPALRRLRDVILDGELGELYYIDSTRMNLGLYQPDVDVVWDLAPHDISLSSYLLQSRPAEVSAWASSHAASRADVAHIRVAFTDTAAELYAHLSWLAPQKTRRLIVAGSRMMAVFDDGAPDGHLSFYERGVDWTAPSAGDAQRVAYRFGPTSQPYIPATEPLAVQDQHFIDCLRSGASPTTSSRDGYFVVCALEAAQRSLSHGAPAPVIVSEQVVRPQLAAPASATNGW